MKRPLALILIVTLALSGCAAIMAGMKVVDTKICPTVEMAKEGAIAAGFLTAYPQFALAYGIFDLLSKGICVANSQLLKALADYDAVVPTVKGVGQVKPELRALRAAVGK
jgi:hypothetical protein